MKDVTQSPGPQGSALLRTERARPGPGRRYGGRMQREVMICLRGGATSLGGWPWAGLLGREVVGECAPFQLSTNQPPGQGAGKCVGGDC